MSITTRPDHARALRLTSVEAVVSGGAGVVAIVMHRAEVGPFQREVRPFLDADDVVDRIRSSDAKLAGLAVVAFA